MENNKLGQSINMAELLKEYRIDLAMLVKRNDLPLIELNLSFPKVHGFNLLDYVLIALSRRHNSLIFISNEYNTSRAYVNTLSLLMNQEEKLTDVLREHKNRVIELYPNYQAVNLTNNLLNKHFYILDIEKLLLEIGDDKKNWDIAFAGLITETQEKKYFLVLENIYYLLTERHKDKLFYQALDFLYAVRGGKINFIAPLAWDSYVKDIENGMVNTIVRFAEPIFFTPRPPHLPTFALGDFNPDVNFYWGLE